jgi:ABC-type multidrug transport system fused ATPase/permease subunit
VSIITLWALFGDDIRILVSNAQKDDTFYILTLICFAIFIIEISMSCYAKDDYLNSFFFYLDLVSTVTLLLDVGWISDSIFGSSSSSAAAAKASTKATRLIRILRLIRLIRIVKLYKAAQQHREKKAQERRKEIMRQRAALEKLKLDRAVRVRRNSNEEGQSAGIYGSPMNSLTPGKYIPNEETPNARHAQNSSIGRLSRAGSLSIANSPSPTKRGNTEGFGAFIEDVKEADLLDNDQEFLKESNVNKTLSANISKIVIILILLLMLSVPLFDSSTYLTDSYGIQSTSFSLLNR